jgi:8-oxo-dGTP diphosphatase
MFSPDGEEVALILKAKPEWQKGKLNGIGGKIEAGELPIAAMVREFEEETGYKTDQIQWWPFATLAGADWTVHFFTTQGPVYELRSTTEERVTVVPWKHVDSTVAIPNLTWLLPMAKSISKERAYAFHSQEEY